jgi:C1A family cysteine protease
MSQIRKYGWMPDLPDIRDFKFKAPRAILRKLPDSVYLAPFCPPTRDQETVGACSGEATTAHTDFLAIKNKVPNYKPGAPMFQYYNTRRLQGDVKNDTGGYLRVAIQAAAKFGICEEELWPYIPSKFAVQPSKEAYDCGAKRQILTYHRIETGDIDQMMGCLADGFPFVFGFSVYDFFESNEMADTGILKMPKASERFLGGHAVMACGYNLKQKRFLILNSWGTRWGLPKLKGYFTIPFSYLAESNLADDFWTIRSQETE